LQACHFELIAEVLRLAAHMKRVTQISGMMSWVLLNYDTNFLKVANLMSVVEAHVH
jgi:hypothetical protein